MDVIFKEFDKDYAPYAFTGNVLDILHRLREASLPDILDPMAIQRLGVSEGNSHRTINTFQYLKLIDSEYAQTPLMHQVAKASTTEYPSVLGQIILDSYSEVLKHFNLENATEVQIMDAFRGRKPKSQWKRMAILFIGLCQEAGLISGEPATADKPTKEEINSRGSANKPNKPNPNQSKEDSELWYSDLKLVFDNLPERTTRTWTESQKQKWLNALETILDLLIEVED